MRSIKIVIFCLLFAFPVVALGFESDDLPSTSTWYFHADFEEMRSSEGGMGLWVWLDDEVFDDVREDVGIDLSEEADHITAYSTPESGVVFVLEGNLKQETKDKALVAAATAKRFDTLKHNGKTFYYIEGDDDGFNGGNVSIDGVDNQGYFSFAIKNKLVAASNLEQMKVLLDNGGKIKGSKSHDGALFVLTAEKSLIQAGMDTDGFSDDDDEEGGFKSNIMRNTKQAALMIADVAGMIAIEAQLITEEPEMADSMASIVRGLIALGMFSDDMEPEVAEFLRSTRVEVDDKVLKVSVTLSPEVLTSALDEA
jgi:hypothetical protein